MSWGSEGASAASTGAGATSGVSSASNSIGGAAGSTGSIYGGMADMGGATGGGTSAGGFSVQPASSGMGPTVDAANMQTYGTSEPSFMQRLDNNLARFQKGEKQSMGQAYDRFGNNPETYGYLYNKAGTISGMGGSGKGGAAPITTNISYQQPENGYLKKRGY